MDDSTKLRSYAEGLGIEFVKTPQQTAHAGIFEPPPNFPRDKFAIEWVPEDQVRYKEQPQYMTGVGAMAPGLTQWKGEDGRSKPERRFASGNKVFVLMVRPLAVQRAMNALYGNVSKITYNDTVRGNSLGTDDQGNKIPLQDPGMLPADRLGGSTQDISESLMSLNRTAEPAAAAEVST